MQRPITAFRFVPLSLVFFATAGMAPALLPPPPARAETSEPRADTEAIP
jgi:hypothetical protein